MPFLADLQLWDLRPGERRRTLLLAATAACILAAHTMVEPVAHALFLNRLGPERLPYLYLLSFLPAAAAASFYSRLARSERLDRLIALTLAFFLTNLLAFRWAFAQGLPGTSIVLYLWSGVFGLLATSQLWLLASHLYDSRAGRRLYGIITMGAILGGVTGGALAARLAPRIGSEDLLLLATVPVGAATVLTVLLARLERDRLRARYGEARKAAIVARADEEGAWPTIRRSPHLRLLVLLGATAIFAATVIDFLFKSVAAGAHPEADDLTAFLGLFQAALSVVSLLLQLVLLGAWAPLLRSLGVARVLGILPAVHLAGAAALLLAPHLLAVSVVKAADASLRYSLHRSTFELLFLPIPFEVKRRTKAVVDLFGDRLARAAAGLVLLALLATGLAVPRAIAGLLALAALALVLVIARLNRAYIASLRASVAGRAIDLEQETVGTIDAAAIAVLRRALAEDSPRQVTYALGLLEQVAGPWLAPDLVRLLEHPAADVRRAALDLLARVGGRASCPAVEPSLADPDLEVQAAAVRFLCRVGPEGTIARFLDHADERLRGAALACLTELGQQGRPLLTRDRLLAALASDGPHRLALRRAVARTLVQLEEPRFADLVASLLADDDGEVRTSAIEAAGRLRDPVLVPRLLACLGDARLREGARRALAAHGDPLLPAIAEAMADPGQPLAVRAALPRVLAYIGSDGAAALLLGRLETGDADLRLATLKALGRLREGQPGAALDGAAVAGEIEREARQHFETLEILHRASHRRRPAPELDLLCRALGENLALILERIFRLLGLRYPPRDIFHIYRRIKHGSGEARASALELLDNLLQPDLRRLVLPILEPPSTEAALAAGRRLFGTTPGDLAACLAQLLAGRDPWVRAVTLRAIGQEGLVELGAAAARAAADPDPWVAAEARWALARLGGATA